MTIYMYYETDGDSGYYHIRLFLTKEKAEKYKKQVNSAYGNIRQLKAE